MARLADIEKTVVTLIMDRRSRERFLSGRPAGKRSRPTAIDAVDPQLVESLDRRGVRLYASLLRIGHHDVVDSIYPGCARLIGQKWDDVVDDFIAKFPPEHYNFNRTAERFSIYLERHGERFLRKYPYLAELADYEWMELAVMERDVTIELFPCEDLSTPHHFDRYAPVVNPTLVVRRYSYPLPAIVDHLRDGCCLPAKVAPSPTAVALYRDPHTHMCRFLELGNLAAAIVCRAAEQPVSYGDLAGAAIAGSPERNPQDTALEFIDLIDSLQEARLFVGSRPIAR